MLGAPGGLRRALNPIELKLQMDVVAGNLTGSFGRGGIGTLDH